MHQVRNQVKDYKEEQHDFHNPRRRIFNEKKSNQSSIFTPQFLARNACVCVHISVRSVFPTTECRS
jgi:hypothetical protein